MGIAREAWVNAVAVVSINQALSINEVTTYRWSFDQDIQRYLAAGIPAIGVWRQKLMDYGESKAIVLLQQSGLAVSNLTWAGGFTGSDGHTYQESLADARDALHLAAALNAGCLVVYSGGRNGHTQNHARRLFRSALEELIPLAESLRVVLAIEPMHANCSEDWTLITNLDEALSLVCRLGSQNLRLAFDTYHFGADPKLCEQLSAIAPYIAIVHLADALTAPDREQNRFCLGEGKLPLERIIGKLRQVGYEGYFDVKLLGESIELHDYDQLLEKTKRAFGQLVSAS